jgi:hypothetical protein
MVQRDGLGREVVPAGQKVLRQEFLSGRVGLAAPRAQRSAHVRRRRATSGVALSVGASGLSCVSISNSSSPQSNVSSGQAIPLRSKAISLRHDIRSHVDTILAMLTIRPGSLCGRESPNARRLPANVRPNAQPGSLRECAMRGGSRMADHADLGVHPLARVHGRPVTHRRLRGESRPTSPNAGRLGNAST